MEEIERKALALVNEVRRERNQDVWKDVGDRKGYGMVLEALCRAIEREQAFRQEVSDAMKLLSEEHEAFRQEVSDAVGWWNMEYLLGDDLRKDMARFIIAKPDPLEEVIADYKRTKGGGEYATNKDMAAALRAALAARGLKIVEVSHD